MLRELPELSQSLQQTFERIEGRLSVLDLFQPGTPLGHALAEMEALARAQELERVVEAQESFPIVASIQSAPSRAPER